MAACGFARHPSDFRIALPRRGRSDIVHNLHMHIVCMCIPIGEAPPPRVFYMGLLLVYCLFVALASIAGGWLPSLVRLTHRRMQLMISVVAGLMLGVAMFHLLPHAVVHLESIDEAVGWSMGGLLSMFFLIRCFHFHSHAL